jgi:hypothetical protein
LKIFDRPDKDDQSMLKIYQYNLLKLLRFLTIKTIDFVLMCIEITFDTELIKNQFCGYWNSTFEQTDNK